MKFARFLLLSVLFPLSGFGAAGMFDQFVIVNTGSSTYYDIGAATGNPDFQGTNLGSYTTSNSLVLGGQGKSYKNGGSNVTGMRLYYRLWQGTASGSFSQLGYNFQIDNVAGVGGDQQWGTDVAGSNGTAFDTGNLLTGLASGFWNLEVYSEISTNGGPIANNNGGSNFTATFSVLPVPEPSRAILLLLGGVGILSRRRRV